MSPFNWFKKKRKIESEEELRKIIAQGEEEGIITEEEEDLITSIFEIGDTPVEEVMVPRVDMISISAESTLSDILNVFIKEGYSKMPVYYHSIDNVIGIIYVNELLKLWHSEKQYLACDLMRLPYFIPYTKNVLDTIREFQQKHISIAVIIDEYGGVYGLVTMEDLVEEILGELQDEMDREEVLFKELKDGSYLIHGKAELDNIEEIFNVNFGDEYDARTIGGLVIEILGKIPQKGDKITIKGLKISVVDATKQKVNRVLVKKI